MRPQALDYLLIGAATADLVKESRVLGGTVSYAAPVLKAFGLNAGIVTSARPDDPLLAELRERASLYVKPAQATTTFENRYQPNGSRSQILHARAESTGIDDVPQVWRAAPLVHLAPLAQDVDPAIAEEFPGATVMLTPQGLFREWDADGRIRFRRWLEPDALRAVDIVVFSRQDIAGAPDLEYEFSEVVDTLIVTDGAQGGVIYEHGVPEPYSAFPVVEIDPTGAGDVFAAAYLAAWGRLRNRKLALIVATRLAAYSVTRVGPLEAVQSQEVEAVLAEVDGNQQ